VPFAFFAETANDDGELQRTRGVTGCDACLIAATTAQLVQELRRVLFLCLSAKVLTVFECVIVPVVKN